MHHKITLAGTSFHHYSKQQKKDSGDTEEILLHYSYCWKTNYLNCTKDFDEPWEEEKLEH